MGRAFERRRRRFSSHPVARGARRFFRSRRSGAWRVRARHSRRYRVLRALREWLRCSSRSPLRPAPACGRDCFRWPRSGAPAGPDRCHTAQFVRDNDLGACVNGGLCVIGLHEAILRLHDAAFRIGEVALRLGIGFIRYKRNTVDGDDAGNQLKLQKPPIKAVVMVAAYRAAARFIEKTHDLFPGMIYTNVSFLRSTPLATSFMLLI